MSGAMKGKGSRRSRHEWRCLLAKFDGSDMGVEAFCRGQAISAASFYRWRNLLDDGGDGAETAAINRTPAFVDLGSLSTAGVSAPRLELKLDLGHGLILHLVRG